MEKVNLLYLRVGSITLDSKQDSNSRLMLHVCFYKNIFIDKFFILICLFKDCLLSSKGQINATRITAVVAGQDDSDYVEVRTRLFPTQSNILRCDVLINGKTYYFNYTEEKIQIFKSTKELLKNILNYVISQF